MLVGDRQRDRADPVPMVEHRRLGQIRDQLQTASTSTSVSGSGSGTRGSTRSVSRREAPLSEDVRERLAGRTARDELAEARSRSGRRLVPSA
jgi:hypothetical protein